MITNIFYIKPIEVTLDYSDFVEDNLGNEYFTELEWEEYEQLKKEYGKFDRKEKEYILDSNNKKYEGYDVGSIECSDASNSYSLFFNSKLAYTQVHKDIVQSITNNKLTVFLDYENITFDKHHLMFENQEIYQKLAELFNNNFTNLKAGRRYLLKIEGVYDKNDSNMLKWELSRIAAINFKTNKWSNWNPTSYSGFVRYENEELILVDSNGQSILKDDN